MKKYILALDEGTTSARAILFDRDSNIIAMSQHEFSQKYPEPGWVEQDPMEIYANQYAALTECIAKSGITPDEIAAVGITNQRETVIVWDKRTGRPIYNAIVWQCRRTSDLCAKMEAQGFGETVSSLTGLRLDPYFSATKIKWILDNVEGARERALAGELAVGTVDTWLIWKLTDGEVFVTDRTNASRTLLCNIHTGEWDEQLLRMFGVPRCMLPQIKSSSEIYGYFNCMGARIPIAGIAGDQQAALFGQGCFEAGQAKNTYGTGCFLLAHTGERAVRSNNGLLTTVAATLAGEPIEYALEGSVFVGGALIRWLRDQLGLISDAKDSEYFASKVADTAGVYLVPAFSGLGTPHWNMDARGTIVGLTALAGKNHIIRASLEAIAYQTQDLIGAMNADMESLGAADGSQTRINSLRVDGGASANNLLMQMQSDFSAIEVIRSANPEATAAGAAYLAGLAVGFFESKQSIRDALGQGRSFLPSMSDADRAAALDGWARALRATQAFCKERC